MLCCQVGQTTEPSYLYNDKLAASAAEARVEIRLALPRAGLRCRLRVLHAMATHVANEGIAGNV